MVCTLRADPLDHQPRVLVEKDAHQSSPRALRRKTKPARYLANAGPRILAALSNGASGKHAQPDGLRLPSGPNIR